MDKLECLLSTTVKGSPLDKTSVWVPIIIWHPAPIAKPTYAGPSYSGEVGK